MSFLLDLILNYIRPLDWTAPSCDAPAGKGCVPLGDIGL